MTRPSPTVWIVHLCGAVKNGRSRVRLSDRIFCATASRASAERLLRMTRMPRGTWWRVQAYVVDNIEGERWPLYYYSNTGRRLARAPAGDPYCWTTVRTLPQ